MEGLMLGYGSGTGCPGARVRGASKFLLLAMVPGENAGMEAAPRWLVCPTYRDLNQLASSTLY